MNFVKKKQSYQAQKDHGMSLTQLKEHSKPNLDDGNRFFEDNKELYASFSQSALLKEDGKKSGFRPKSSNKPPAFVPVTHD